MTGPTHESAEGPRVLIGPRAVTEALRAGNVQNIYIETRRRGALRSLIALAAEKGVTVSDRPRHALDALARGGRHQGVVAQSSDLAFEELSTLISARPAPLLLMLDEITDPHNLGAIIRSAVAFDVTGIIVPKRRTAPFTETVSRAAAGATEHARIARVTNLAQTLALLSEEGFQTVALVADGATPIDALPPAPRGRVIVVGSEGKGIRRLVQERCEILASIPMAGPIDSLNASVAAAVALYAAGRS